MKTPFRAIAWTGFLVGLLDGMAAVVNYLINDGGNPVRIFYYIASGIFGKTAFTSGIQMLFWGVFFHFLIACGFTAFYFWLYPRIKFISTHTILSGIGYGILVWMVMNLIIVPFSHTPKLPFNGTQALIGILIHVCFVGLPVSVLAHYFFNRHLKQQV